jgi:hypothetical protein
MTTRSPFPEPAQANGRRRPTAFVAPLCAETQGREIVAALVNDAVEEALGIGLAGIATHQRDTLSPNSQSRPDASRK